MSSVAGAAGARGCSGPSTGPLPAHLPTWLPSTTQWVQNTVTTGRKGSLWLSQPPRDSPKPDSAKPRDSPGESGTETQALASNECVCAWAPSLGPEDRHTARQGWMAAGRGRRLGCPSRSPLGSSGGPEPLPGDGSRSIT